MKNTFKLGITTVALGLAGVGAANALPIGSGSVAFTDIGVSTVTSINDSILNASSYGIQLGFFKPGGTGDLSTLGSLVIGPLTFTPTSPSGFVINDPVFGKFTSTSIVFGGEDTTPGNQSITYNVYGIYDSGLFDGYADANVAAKLTESWTQTGGPGSAVSTSGTFAFPAYPTSAPDGGLTAGLLGGALMGLGALRRKFMA